MGDNKCVDCGMPIDDKTSCDCDNNVCRHCCKCDDECDCGCGKK